MFKFLFIIIFLFTSFKAISSDDLLTIQQEIDRLQREVSDLSKIVFSNKQVSTSNIDNDLVTNFSAIDIRIYDLEKDVKNLTAGIEEIYFQIEDLSKIVKNLETLFQSFEINLAETKKKDVNENYEKSDNEVNTQNTLGSLKITQQESSELENSNTNNNVEDEGNTIALTPEDQFQAAFDNIRNKNWIKAKNSLQKFISDNPDNQLSGSAHYWLGELFILEKKYRDSALVLAEGYQKYPESIKAPDMLFKLSISLYEVNKINDSCKTLEKFILDFPKNKFIKNAKKQLQNYGCLEATE
tara:strand:+ start:666 stop:1559 length:894 start_codon:yes stop_codon:yes gene_type:complete